MHFFFQQPNKSKVILSDLLVIWLKLNYVRAHFKIYKNISTVVRAYKTALDNGSKEFGTRDSTRVLQQNGLRFSLS